MPQSSGTAIHPPRRFFYGYIMIISGFFIMLAYSATRSVFGIFFDPMIEQFHWSAALLSGVFSLSIVMDGISGIGWGRITDKWGPKKVLLICGLISGAGYIILALVNSIWQMYLIYGVIIGIGMGGIFVPVSTTLPRWFVARRNMANGLALVGMGIGTLIISPIAYWLVTRYDWPLSYVIIGVAFLVVVLAATWFIKSSPAEVGQQPYMGKDAMQSIKRTAIREYTLSEAMKTPQMWITFMMFFCFGYSSISMMVHLVPHIIDIDISAATAASVMAAVGAINVFGRLSFGFLGDKVGSIRSYLLGFLVILGSMIWLIFMRQTWMFYAYAALWGLSAGGMGSVQTPIIAELFGVKSLGVIFGVCGLGVMVGGSLGPVITGYLFDIMGNYQAAFAVCAVFAVVGIILNLWLTRVKREAEKRNAVLQPTS